jgi:hypothetical protein
VLGCGCEGAEWRNNEQGSGRLFYGCGGVERERGAVHSERQARRRRWLVGRIGEVKGGGVQRSGTGGRVAGYRPADLGSAQ